MSQYRTGTAAVTNGSATVTLSGASAGAENVAVGDSFKLDLDGDAIYQVASRTPASGASLTSITLSVVYAGSTVSGSGYQVTSDFTPNRNYPELAQGDADAADWITRALRTIDQDISYTLGDRASTDTNTGIGYQVFNALTTGTNNTAAGYQALYNNTTGYQNVAVGYAALSSNTTGYLNTATGDMALFSNTTGYLNTATGSQALYNNTTGTSNTATGYQALYSNTTGTRNVAIGESALYSNVSGYGSVAIGFQALTYSTVDQQIGIGYQALLLATTGGEIAIGYQALTACTTGVSNVAIGTLALNETTIGIQNIAVGGYALRRNTTGNYGTAIGFQALTLNTTGVENTACGYQAAYANTIGKENTAVGFYALGGNTTGNDNTAIGRSAMSASTIYVNCTALGANTAVTGSNQCQIGDSATTTYVYGTVQNRSDRRDKTDIRDTALGLNFITALRPVDFKWDYREDYREQISASDTPEERTRKRAASKLDNLTSDGTHARTRYHHGLIAQEVQDVLTAQGIDFGGLQNHLIKGGDDAYTLGYAELIAPLIRSIQELDARVKTLEGSHA